MSYNRNYIIIPIPKKKRLEIEVELKRHLLHKVKNFNEIISSKVVDLKPSKEDLKFQYGVIHFVKGIFFITQGQLEVVY